MEQERCWIFGDEAGNMGVDRFFAVGVIGTKKPKEIIEVLRRIRERTGYNDEVSYKSGNARRMLCAIRWVDWFLSGNQEIAHFKILIKDAKEFDVGYFKENRYGAGAAQLAYCESYREVMCNFAGYNSDPKGFVYSQIGLAKMQLVDYLDGKVAGLTKDQCITKSPHEKKKDGKYTGTAELLQLCDLLTSSTRGLCCSLFGEETSETWDKNMLRKNIHYHIPDVKEKLSANQNVYYPTYSPFDKQKFVIYKWKGGKRQNAPISFLRK